MKNRKIDITYDNIEIVLVESQGAGNIGSVARAMKNCGFSRLTLVNPCEYLVDECWMMACSADDIIKNARVVPTLKEALKDSTIAVATTARGGKGRSPHFTLNEASREINKIDSQNKISIIFGREDKGLKNEELSLCDMFTHIPAHEDYTSFNLAQSVLLVCHSIFSAEVEEKPTLVAEKKERVEKMYVHLEEALKSLNYGTEEFGHKGEYLMSVIMRNFRRLFGRTLLEEKEVQMIRGILTRIIDTKGKKK